jgi:hypothetical protein
MARLAGDDCAISLRADDVLAPATDTTGPKSIAAVTAVEAFF